MPSNRPVSSSFNLFSFDGGQSDYENKGIKGSFKAGMNLDIRKQKDTLSCQQALKDDLAVGTFTAPCYFIVPSSDGNTYFLTNDGKIYKRTSAGVYTLVYTETQESGQIIGAAEWYHASASNPSNNWTYLIWATPTTLNIKKLIGPGYTQVEPWTDVNNADTGSWPKTTLTSTTWHTMTGANGVLQICNGNVMALVGNDLSYSNLSLALIPGNDARCVLERSKYGVIGCRDSTGKDQTTLFTWDGIGLHWNDKQIIKFGGINSMIDTELALMQIGTNGQFYISDFNNPMPFRQIRGGGTSYPDGMAGYKGMALIGIYNNTNTIGTVLANGVYSLGRINKNANLVLNLEYQLTCDEITSVKTVGTDILVAYKIGSTYGVKIVDTANRADAIYQSLDLIAPVGKGGNPLGRLVSWDRVDLECQPLPASCKIECWYKFDKNTTGGLYNDGWIQSNIEPGNTGSGTQFQGTGNQNAVFYIGQKARTLEVMLKLIHSGNTTPEINEVNVSFSAG